MATPGVRTSKRSDRERIGEKKTRDCPRCGAPMTWVRVVIVMRFYCETCGLIGGHR